MALRSLAVGREGDGLVFIMAAEIYEGLEAVRFALAGRERNPRDPAQDKETAMVIREFTQPFFGSFVFVKNSSLSLVAAEVGHVLGESGCGLAIEKRTLMEGSIQGDCTHDQTYPDDYSQNFFHGR
jgi:hypothetical protein